MAESQVFTSADIVKAAAENDALNAKSAFGNIMLDKIRDAIAGKREEMASTLLTTPENNTEVEVTDNA
jgi:hypothetical protein